jgi:glycosyltransferase involved in cell wall biosynthesis
MFNSNICGGVVIIGRNEGERLKKCLYSVLKSGWPLVYVDSDSNDDSVNFAKSLAIDVVKLDATKHMNAAVARNSGFKQIMQLRPELNYIHFIDADCELDSGWLDEALTFFKDNSDNVAVCGRLREKNINLSWYARQCDMSWYIKPGEIESCGGIATINAVVFKKLNGFDETLIAGEEADFYTRAKALGHKVHCIEKPMGTHDSAMVSLKQWWVRNIRTGFVYADNVGKVNYNSQRRGILIWGAIIPFAIAGISLINLLGISLSLIYPAQIIRIALKLNIPYKFNDKLLEGFFCVFSKSPQLLGLVKYKFNTLLKRDVKIIEYKR